MKLALTAAVLLSLASSTPAFAGPYFNTVLKDPLHIPVSMQVLFTPQFGVDGGVTDAAMVWHKGSPDDSMWPQTLLNLGFPPVSWTLLELGAGGNTEDAFVHAGAGLNVAPTVLGPLTQALSAAGGTYAAFGKLLVAPDGTGLSLSAGWKANVIKNGVIPPLDQLTFPPRFGVGYIWVF